jgi:hypothetical protein
MRTERRLLQLAIALAASVAVMAGGAGAFEGPRFFDLAGDTTAMSHAHYLAGLLLGIGLAFWSMIPRIERHGQRLRLLATIVVCGGLVRLVAIGLDGVPDKLALAALANETVVPVLLCLWQARVARKMA